MLLIEWMRKEGLTLQSAADRIGYSSPGSLYNAVVGHHVPRAWMMAKILAATNGEVTANDLFECWRRRHEGKPYVKREFDNKTTRGPASMRTL